MSRKACGRLVWEMTSGFQQNFKNVKRVVIFLYVQGNFRSHPCVQSSPAGGMVGCCWKDTSCGGAGPPAALYKPRCWARYELAQSRGACGSTLGCFLRLQCSFLATATLLLASFHVNMGVFVHSPTIAPRGQGNSCRAQGMGSHTGCSTGCRAMGLTAFVTRNTFWPGNR